MLTLIVGGARSGKSRLAQKLAASQAGPVTYIATAQAGTDLEMIERVAHHRSNRSPEWRTVEEPLALAKAVQNAASGKGTIVVDCLTIWLSNLFFEYRDRTSQLIEKEVRAHLGSIASTAGGENIILVSNDLGSGTVPEAALTRAFRDLQGLMNQWAAELADAVILTVAGLPLYLKGSTNKTHD